jgi:type II secretory pathway pseudopilin PulG
VQLVVVLGILAVLATLTFSVVGNTRAAAKRAQCDTRLKVIALALDTYRQENGRFPAKLSELISKKYITDTQTLHCPADPRPVGEFDANAALPNGSYEEYYIPRAPRQQPRGKTEVPVVVCPLHEKAGNHGAQAYIGRQTKQFATRPAKLLLANGTSVQSPGKEALAATAGMELHGGDRIRTSSGGLASIQFADGSLCEVLGGSDLTLLQCFMEGNPTGAPLYTLIRQTRGEVTYTVSKGSDFDVVTPTATAGVAGTRFRISIDGNGVSRILLTEGELDLFTLQKAAKLPRNLEYLILPGLPGLPPVDLKLPLL